MDELTELAVPDLADDDCVCFMWATMPMLPEALQLMKSWGFTYRTVAFTWVKLNRTGKLKTVYEFLYGLLDKVEALIPDKVMAKLAPSLVLEGGVYSGLGHWTNGNAEIVLFGRKGLPKRVAKNVKQICFAPVSSHSAKPPEIRDRIVRLMGDVPRIELFARGDLPDGWHGWGNEVGEGGVNPW
jgi:N6-adenosine-specific RNA methylase IME4